MGQPSSRRYRVALPRVVLVCLACALLAPKLSLAAAMLLGDGYRSVVICSGSELRRVTLSPGGEIVDDVTEAWVAPHCVLTQHDVERFSRAWRLVDYPRRFLVAGVPSSSPLPSPRLLDPAVAARGPPPFRAS